MAPEVKSALKNNFANFRTQPHSIDNIGASKPLESKEKDVKTILLNLWTDVLSCNSINEDSNFFNLGGDSLLITSLIRKVNQAFGVRVPPRKMLAAKTLRDQATLIKEVLAL